jgi:DNA-binding MarR family transcriptional regulator
VPNPLITEVSIFSFLFHTFRLCTALQAGPRVFDVQIFVARMPFLVTGNCRAQGDIILLMKELATEDYQALAEFRRGIRGYIRFSERAVRKADVEPRQYQILLVLKGLPAHVRPRIVELAAQLQIRHHSAVELVDRLEQRKLVFRERGAGDRREVLVRLTPKGEKLITALVRAHFGEVFSCGPVLLKALQTALQRAHRFQD